MTTYKTQHKGGAVMADRAKIFIVDDHPIVVQGYLELINRQKDLVVCGHAAVANDALRKIKQTAPDLIVVDLTLKDSNGLDLIRDINARMDDVKMLVVSARDEALFAERALHLGAMGYVGKEEATEKLIDAIHAVLADKIFLSEAMTNRLLHKASGNSDLGSSPVAGLTNRELEVFELIGRGCPTRQIAKRLFLSHRTIERHRENIKQKLNLNNATELVQRAAQWMLENAQ